MADTKRQRVLFETDESDETKPPAASQTKSDQAARPLLQEGESPASLDGQTVYIVNAHGLIYQVFHAMPDMTGPQGQPVGAIHGFIRDMADLLERKKPDFLFCAFDHSEVTFRNNIYEQYKAHREEMPIDLRPQISSIRRLLQAMRISVIACPNYEADDILATVARQVDELGGKCYLVSNDKDCRQLIGPNVSIYNIRKDTNYTPAMLMSDWGVRPDQVVDFQALVGDAVDNVPGVPQIGAKTARELLQQFETLEGVLDNAGQVKAKRRRENLQNGRDVALLSRQLVRLDQQTPIQVDWAEGCVGAMDQSQVQSLCREFGFRRLGERLRGLDFVDTSVRWETNYQTISDASALDAFVDMLQHEAVAAIAIEQSATAPSWADILGLGFCWREGSAFYLPLAGAGQHLEREMALGRLKPWLEDATKRKIGQNLKNDLTVLRCHGIQLAGADFDTMVADYLLDPGERNHTIADLAHRYLQYQTVDRAEVVGAGKAAKPIQEIELSQLIEYEGQRVDVPWRVAETLRQRLDEDELTQLFEEIEIPLTRVLAEMEFNGVAIDVERLERLGNRFGDRLEKLEAEIHELAGHSFNIESPKQLGEVLYEELQLPVLRRSRTGPSTAADVLSELAVTHPHPLLERVLEFRRHAKLKGTYIDALPRLVNPRTQRVHTVFKQDVAATGRLSSVEPNLQNIPIRTSDGREIRSAFVASSADSVLLTADYSQIELRVLAHFSKDEALWSAFENDEDIHQRVAAEVFAVPAAGVSSEQRRRAKAINFGVIYGQTPFGLAKSLGISKDEAAQFIDAYFNRYGGVEEFMAEVLTDCRQNGYVSTILGRRRIVQGVRSAERRGNLRHRNLPERMAVNTVIQGSAADLIKQAMLRTYFRLQKDQLRAKMLLQIHDELLFECPHDEAEPLVEAVREEMLAACRLDVPLQVDIGVGPNWADCEPWDNIA